MATIIMNTDPNADWVKAFGADSDHAAGVDLSKVTFVSNTPFQPTAASDEAEGTITWTGPGGVSGSTVVDIDVKDLQASPARPDGYLNQAAITDIVTDGISITFDAPIAAPDLSGATVGGVPSGQGSAAKYMSGDDSIYNFGIAARLHGYAGADALFAGSFGDTLDGGAGADTMYGGDGADTFYVDDSGDQILTFAPTPGGSVVKSDFDTVYASASWTAGTGADVQRIVAQGKGGLYLTGNLYAMTIEGNATTNKLDDGGGQDTLKGGDGSDVYVVHNAKTQIVETPTGGYDSVRTDVASYILAANVESLTYTGSAAFKGVGNAASNLIVGGAGNDTLDGGAGGSDRLAGGAGDDTYYTHNAGDIAVESAGGGTDTILTTANLAQAQPNVEALGFIGSGAFTGFAAATGTAVTGGAGNDKLFGGAGSDTLDGGAAGGSDTLYGGAGADTFVLYAAEGSGSKDTVLDFHTGVDHVRVALPPGADPDVFQGGFISGQPPITDLPGGRFPYQYVFYDQASGRLYQQHGATDSVAGLYPGQREVIAQFMPGTELHASDIVVG